LAAATVTALCQSGSFVASAAKRSVPDQKRTKARTVAVFNGECIGSAVRPTPQAHCNRSAMAGFAAAHG